MVQIEAGRNGWMIRVGVIVSDYAFSKASRKGIGLAPLLGSDQIPVSLRHNLAGVDIQPALSRPLVLGPVKVNQHVPALFDRPDEESAALVGIGLFSVPLDCLQRFFFHPDR